MQETVDRDGSAWVTARTIDTPTARECAEWTLLAADKAPPVFLDTD